MTTPIVEALPVAEAALLAALASCAPVVAWALLPAETARGLARYGVNAADTGAIARAIVAQHQDGGGDRDDRFGSTGWQGSVVVRCLAATDAQAAAGFALAAAAMAAPASPTGYALSTMWERPVSVPPLDQIYTRAGQWRVYLRRTT